METSLFIARIIGVLYFSLGIGLLLYSGYYREFFQKVLEKKGFMFLGGMLAIIVGFLIIENHSVYTDVWTSIISIIGWLALIKGIIIFAFPKSFGFFTSLMQKKTFTYVLTPFVLIFGLFFLYYGFLR
jgi:hypothetical protein